MESGLRGNQEMEIHQGTLHGPCTRAWPQDTLRARWGPLRLYCRGCSDSSACRAEGRKWGQLRQAEMMQEESRAACVSGLGAGTLDRAPSMLQRRVDGPLGYLIPPATVIAVFTITLDPGGVGKGRSSHIGWNLFLKTESCCSPFFEMVSIPHS